MALSAKLQIDGSGRVFPPYDRSGSTHGSPNERRPEDVESLWGVDAVRSLSIRSRRSHIGGHLRRPVALLLICGLASLTAPAATAQAGDAQPPALIVAPTQDEQIDVPTGQSISALGGTLPQDPTLAADQLVALITGPVSTQSATAVAELLRRAAIPIVTTDGAVIGAPSDITLGGDPIYAEFTVQLARSVRNGTSYDASQLANLLVPRIFQFDDGESLPPDDLVAAMGEWGKDPGAPVESQVAGAAFRALSASRGDILFGQGFGNPQFDLLQTTLLLAHASGDTTGRFSASGTTDGRSRALAGGLAASDANPCATPEEPVPGTNGVLKQQVKSVIKSTLPKAAQGHFSSSFDAVDTGLSVISMILLLTGAKLDLEADKDTTHFKHSSNDDGQRVKMTSIASFDPVIAANNEAVKCFALAGISMPPAGFIKGFRIRWTLDQDKGFYPQHAGGYASKPFLDDKYLEPINPDTYKIDSCGSCGELTDNNGESHLTLAPPRELKPGEGAELYGVVRVKAAMDKDDIPRFIKLSDFTGLASIAALPEYWALKRLIDIGINAITRAGLPSQSKLIYVEYHGKNMYRVQGTVSTKLPGAGSMFPSIDIMLDLYTCTGLRDPNVLWKGKGGVTNEDIGSLAKVAGAFAGMFSQMTLEPAAARSEAAKFAKTVANAERDAAGQKPFKDPLDAQPDPLQSAPLFGAAGSYHDDFTINSDVSLTGTMTISNVPPAHLFDDGIAEKHIDGVVGDVLIKLGGEGLDQPQLGLERSAYAPGLGRPRRKVSGRQQGRLRIRLRAVNDVRRVTLLCATSIVVAILGLSAIVNAARPNPQPVAEPGEACRRPPSSHPDRAGGSHRRCLGPS